WPSREATWIRARALLFFGRHRRRSLRVSHLQTPMRLDLRVWRRLYRRDGRYRRQDCLTRRYGHRRTLASDYLAGERDSNPRRPRAPKASAEGDDPLQAP